MKKKFIKTKNPEDFQAYKKQRNYIVNLNRRSKKIFFEKTAASSKNGDKSFWKACKPFFSNKEIVGCNERIFLNTNGTLITNETEVANGFNKYYTNIAKPLSLEGNEPSSYCIDKILLRHGNHPSIPKIKESLVDRATFNFSKNRARGNIQTHYETKS